jgi:hypothetical protein
MPTLKKIAILVIYPTPLFKALYSAIKPVISLSQMLVISRISLPIATIYT